jgi:hypothetical protein
MKDFSALSGSSGEARVYDGFSILFRKILIQTRNCQDSKTFGYAAANKISKGWFVGR